MTLPSSRESPSAQLLVVALASVAAEVAASSARVPRLAAAVAPKAGARPAPSRRADLAQERAAVAANLMGPNPIDSR